MKNTHTMTANKNNIKIPKNLMMSMITTKFRMSINQLINILTTNTNITMTIRIPTNNMVSLMTIMINTKYLTLIIKKKTIILQNKLIRITIYPKINTKLKRNLHIKTMNTMIMRIMRIKKRNHPVKILMRSRISYK